MECVICGKPLVKNGVRNGVQYYYCTHCKKSYSNKKREPKRHIIDEYIVRSMYFKCIKHKNKFTQTIWTYNQIARFLNHHHRDIVKWANNKSLPIISEKKFIEHIETREHGFDILCVLGYRQAAAPSDYLYQITHRKKCEKFIKDENDDKHFHITESEYLRLVNMPITNRKEAIFVLGALLGCRTSEILGAKYSDFDMNNKTVYFHRTVTFGKEIEISENNLFVSYRMYPLTNRMIDIIKWLKDNSEHDKQQMGEKYSNDFSEFICTQENGTLFNSFALNKKTKDIRVKASITTRSRMVFLTNEIIREFRFKWLRYSVKLMMLKAGVSQDDVKSIFGYNSECVGGINNFEITRNAYECLDRYIDEHSEK